MSSYIRKMIILCTIVIFASLITYLSYDYLFVNNNLVTNGSSLDLLFSSEGQDTRKDVSIDSHKEDSIKSIAEKDKEYVCGDSKVNSNRFIREFVLPFPCSQPLGLAVDKDNNIWIAANWIGRFLVFDTSTNTFVKNISIPIKGPQTTFGSMIWELKFDKNADLWFADQRSNSIWRYFVAEDKFERYKTPTPSYYPMSLTFDSLGQVWYTNVFGKNLGILNPYEVEK